MPRQFLDHGRIARADCTDVLHLRPRNKIARTVDKIIAKCWADYIAATSCKAGPVAQGAVVCSVRISKMYHFSISSNSAMLDDHHQSGDNDDFYDDGDDDVAKCAGKAISIIMRSNTSERPTRGQLIELMQ